jgi:hypothetical protein
MLLLAWRGFLLVSSESREPPPPPRKNPEDPEDPEATSYRPMLAPQKIAREVFLEKK